MQEFDCDQGSLKWMECRAGIITASCMSQVLAKGEGKTRAAYMHKLIGEIITGESVDSFASVHTERGKEMEPEARDLYAATCESSLRQVGFIRNFDDIGGVGYSPDTLVGDDGLLEIKTKLPHLQVELLLANRLPPEHKAQIQCGLWVTGRKWLDFISYWPGMPLYRVRVERDEDYISTMKEAVVTFYAEMNTKLNKVMGMTESEAA